MNILHLLVENDAVGQMQLAVLKSVIEAAGGLITLSQSHGHGPAYLVILLPDELDPAALGLAGAQHVGHATVEAKEDDDDDEYLPLD